MLTVLGLVVVLLIGEDRTCGQAAEIQCLSCERVQKPEDCTNRHVCAPQEGCFTERYITKEGHVFYDLGCKLLDTCKKASFYLSRSQVMNRRRIIGRRQQESVAVHVCEECCDFDHCNNQLCGGHAIAALKCLNCDTISDMKHCEKLTTCRAHEVCYLEEGVSDQFNLEYHSGCMRETQCEAFKAAKIQSGGIFDPCVKCCNQSFCNAQCGDVTTTVSSTITTTTTPTTTTPQPTTTTPQPTTTTPQPTTTTPQPTTTTPQPPTTTPQPPTTTTPQPTTSLPTTKAQSTSPRPSTSSSATKSTVSSLHPPPDPHHQ